MVGGVDQKHGDDSEDHLPYHVEQLPILGAQQTEEVEENSRLRFLHEVDIAGLVLPLLDPLLPPEKYLREVGRGVGGEGWGWEW